MRKLFISILMLFVFGCSSSHSSTTGNTIHQTWTIDDTFFYRKDGFFRQYPKELFAVEDCWFAGNPFMIVAVPDTNSLIQYDTAIECNQDDSYCDTITGYHYSGIVILKSYSMPDKSKFRYQKLMP